MRGRREGGERREKERERESPISVKFQNEDVAIANPNSYQSFGLTATGNYPASQQIHLVNENFSNSPKSSDNLTAGECASNVIPNPRLSPTATSAQTARSEEAEDDPNNHIQETYSEDDEGSSSEDDWDYLLSDY